MKNVKDQRHPASAQSLPSGMGRVLLKQTADPACLSAQQVCYLHEAQGHHEKTFKPQRSFGDAIAAVG